MSTPKSTTISPRRLSAIEVAVDLSLSDMEIWAGISRNKLQQHMHDPIDPLPAYNMGRKWLVNKSEYLEWRSRRFSSTKPDPAIVAPRRRRRKVQG